MSAANRQAQAGEAQIKLFEFYSNYDNNKSLNVSSSCIELNYYESILDNTIRATATFVDTGYRNSSEGSAIVEESDLNLTVGERVNLKVSDGNQFVLDLTGPKHLRIKETRDIDESTNKLTFTVDLFSKESIDNEFGDYRVGQRYDDKVSDAVERILKQTLKTEKEVDIDDTLNSVSLLPLLTKPFYLCTWLGPRSVPDVKDAKGNLAGFFFYETYDGFKFKSIDKLFQQKPKRKLIFDNIIEPTPPEGYDGKILDYYFDSTFDLKKSLVTGDLFNTKLKAVNAYESAYRENVFDYKSQELTDNLGGKEFPLVASDLKAQEKFTRISYKWDDPGFLVPGKDLKSQLPKSTYINYNNDEILRQSYVRYNNLFNVKLSIAIAGDMSLRAGDLLHCDFPEVTSNATKTYSKKKSGIYMITDVCHRVTKNSCYTRLNLVRESIGRKSS